MDGYSDQVFNTIKRDAQIWYEAFAETDTFKAWDETVQENACFIITCFCERMYDYHLQSPKDWTTYALGDVIGDIFPRKITADEDLFYAVESVLLAFLQYLGEHKLINNANELIQALKKAIPTMLETINDSAKWGPAKQLAMAAMQSGVDLEDRQAMNQFIESFHASRNDGIRTPVANTPKIGRNSPCPWGSGRKYKHCCGKNA